MRLRVDRVKQLMHGVRIDREQLAQAIDRPEKAVRNWLAGRDHPRCKASDIRGMARALNVALPEIARFTSMVRFHRGGTQKARLVADMVRGKAVDEALNTLAFSGKRAATNVYKALQAAIADAEVNDADITRLVICDSFVDEGPQIKRFRPKDRGRAHPIIKQTSHITIAVETLTEVEELPAFSADEPVATVVDAAPKTGSKADDSSAGGEGDAS